MAKVVADQRARQGGPGRPVLYVLVASLILVAVCMAGYMTWAGSKSPPSPQGATTSGTSSGNSSAVPAGNPAYPAPAAPQSGSGTK